MRPGDTVRITRRDVLAGGLATAGALLVGERPVLAAPSEGGAYGPFQMGLQSYSLRGLKRDGKVDVARALAVTRDLGISYWESYRDHVPQTTDAAQVASYQRELAAAGVKVVGYGVTRLTKDQAKNRELFQFAKLMGLSYLSIDPEPSVLDSVDRLIEEFDVAAGIHNHGPGHHFDKIDTIANAIKDHHPKLGCCIDTGHFLRSREDPVRAVEVFGKRIFGVHLKDVKDATRFTMMGQGDLRTVDLLQGLAKLKYGYLLALEYEEHPQDPIAEIRECLKVTREAIASIKT